MRNGQWSGGLNGEACTWSKENLLLLVLGHQLFDNLVGNRMLMLLVKE